MQGLPTQQLSKSAAGSVKVHSHADGKAQVEGQVGESAEGDKGDFSSLFANLTGKAATGSVENKSEKKSESETKESGVKSGTGEILKNLLAEKHSEKNSTGKVAVDPKKAEELAALALAAAGKNGEAGHATKTSLNPEQKLAKTNSNLDQLLNNLKGTQDSDESVEAAGGKNSDALQGMRGKKGEHMKGDVKAESPLDFLMKETKSKGVGENTEGKTPKVMTGEDFIKNLQTMDSKENSRNTLEKKSAATLALIDGGKAELAKNMNQNVKGYAQGSNLLNNSMIKNTNDLAFKGAKTGKASSDELKNPDLKVSAELAGIKQEVIPTMQNKNAHGQQQNETQTQANQKVLDLSKINTTNTNEIIKRISDYVEQNQVANKSSLDLTVKHDSLGEFKIQVSKQPSPSMNSTQGLIDMQITTSSKEGHDFFVKNEVSLMKNLSQAGINLSDLRIVSTASESSAFGHSDSKQSSSFQQNADGSEKRFASFDSQSFTGDSSNGNERRQELWQEYQQRYGA